MLLHMFSRIGPSSAVADPSRVLSSAAPLPGVVTRQLSIHQQSSTHFLIATRGTVLVSRSQSAMPRGVNEKVQAARDRKAAAKDEQKTKAAKAAEDAVWAAAGDGAKSKAQAKRDEQERQRQEAAAKKLEAKRLAAEEEEALSRPKSATKAPKVSGPKMTHYQLQQLKEEEEAQRAAEQQERQLAARREVTEDSYSAIVETVNTNRQEDAVEARGVGQAIDALASLSVGGPSSTEKHPEKRARAAWKVYEERELPRLKQEKPNLKQSQYRDMLWRAWLKSPENPIVAAAAAGNS